MFERESETEQIIRNKKYEQLNNTKLYTTIPRSKVTYSRLNIKTKYYIKILGSDEARTRDLLRVKQT